MKILRNLLATLTILGASFAQGEENKWLCVEDANQSVYPLSYTSSELRLQFDASSNPWIFNIQTISDNGVVFATQAPESTPIAKNGDCSSCLTYSALIFDPVRGLRSYYSHHVGYENGKISEQSWVSIHKCTKNF
jgi:hypothetical protein